MSNGSPSVLVVACMKDEGPFILEWISYYKSIGVTDFIILSNDCSDGTDDILDCLDEMGIIKHLPNPCMIGENGNTIQNSALKYAALQKEFRRADWVLIVDADEFLNLNIGKRDFSSLFENLGKFDAISFNQVVFGSGGVEKFVDKPVLEQFNRRFNFEGSIPRRWPKMYGIKTLLRNDPEIFSRITNHIPRMRRRSEIDVVWLDGSGRAMHPDFIMHLPRSYPTYYCPVSANSGTKHRRTLTAFPIEHGTHDLGYVNHYALRSLYSFIAQSRRGDAVNPTIKRDLNYWTTYNRNGIQDTSIHSSINGMKNVQAEIFSNVKISKLHSESVDKYNEIIERMLVRPEVALLIEECRSSFFHTREDGEDLHPQTSDHF